jgi:hypothetical protein
MDGTHSRRRPRRLGRDRAACGCLIRSRCQRSTVSGRTSSRIRCSVSGLIRCSSAASSARSGMVNRTLLPPSWRSSTAIWWRRTNISGSLSRSLVGRRRRSANAFVTVKYASRNSTAGHHAAAITLAVTVPVLCQGDEARHPEPPDAVTLTCTDGIFGTRRVFKRYRNRRRQSLNQLPLYSKALRYHRER